MNDQGPRPLPFNHFDRHGQAVMVDICAKQPSQRTATARARVLMHVETLRAILDFHVTKGDVLGVARLAGIGAAKKTHELIPLAHPLALHHVGIDFQPAANDGMLEIRATVKACERTGVEMEAMVAASVAALTVYDMCKGADKGIRICDVELLYKEGGKSGVYRREAGP